jgi:hypothetical protein
MSIDDVPRMTATYIKSMMTFKDYLKPKHLEKKTSMPEIYENTDLFTKIKRKMLTEKKYNGFVDRIYGKVTRERNNLLGVFNVFRNEHNKKSKNRFLSSEE